MTYATKADILEQLPEADLIALTDDTGTGEADQSVVDRSLADADAQVDAYVQARYQVPLSPVPPAIRRIAVDLAVYDLFSRRSIDCPDLRKDRHKAAVGFLEQVVDGRITLGAGTAAAGGDNLAVMEGGGQELTTRTTMRGY
ncbi:MAG: gp436 family protein [Desulfobulbaceae bacterium]